MKTVSLNDALKRVSLFLFQDELNRKHMSVKVNNAVAQIESMLHRPLREDDYINFNDGKRFRFSFRCAEHYRANSFYGIASSIKKYSGYKKKINGCIEHGLYLGDYYNPYEAVNSGLPWVFTMSEARRTVLNKYGSKQVAVLGPYIQYAERNEEFEACLRRELNSGGTLLVFPTHSIETISIHRNLERFISQVDKAKRAFGLSNVIVNLYFMDIDTETVKRLRDNGFVVTCCGNRTDPLFLSRQRSLIEIADVTCSDGFGTHIGYALSCNTPHFVFGSDASASTSMCDISAHVYLNAEQQRIELEKLFSERTDSISEEQMSAASHFWGVGMHLSSSELLLLLERAEHD